MRASRLWAVSLLSALALALGGGVEWPRTAAAQEYQEVINIVPDSAFVENLKVPVNYQTIYQYDQSRDSWIQSLGYSPSWKNLVLGLTGETATSEDILESRRRSTNGDLAGNLSWRTFPRLVLSLSGRYSMSSIAEGGRSSSTAEQRRNTLGFTSQYAAPPIKKALLTVMASSEFTRNYDFRVAHRPTNEPDTATQYVATELDSSFASGRMDALRGSVSWPFMRGFNFSGSAHGSRTRPTLIIRTLRLRTPTLGGADVVDSTGLTDIALPTDNAFFNGALLFDRIAGHKFLLESKRTGIDQVYYDLGQLLLERLSIDGTVHHFRAEGAPKPGAGYNLDAMLTRSQQKYIARPILSGLGVTRKASGDIFYQSSLSQYFLRFEVTRARTEGKLTGNGVTLNRLMMANLAQRVLGRLWLTGTGSATLSSYQYDFAPAPGRTFSKDDRDISSSFANLGARFAITPRCSTTLTFSISRSHNVAVDASVAAGNFANTVYQINGALRLSPIRNLSIWQDYIATAADRSFDYSQQRDGLSRNFRIDTAIADTLFPFAFVRVDHRYFFQDQGSFSPVSPGGPRLYGPATEQIQQALDGRIGIRPISGVTLVVKQSLTDTENRDLSNGNRTRTGHWNLSFSAEMNRSFWNGAGLVGSVRREENFLTQINSQGVTRLKDQWLVNIVFQKDF